MSKDTRSSAADEIVDDLMPIDLDWRRLVCSYPIPALAVAATGGFVLGRRHGPALVAALGTYVSEELTANVESLLGTPRASEPSAG